MSENSWAKWKEFKEKIMECDKVFVDTKGHFAEKDIEELFKMGIINGKTEERFMLNEPVTRGEMAAIVRRVVRDIMGK